MFGHTKSFTGHSVGSLLYRAIERKDENTFFQLLANAERLPSLSEVRPVNEGYEEEPMHPLALAIHNSKIFEKLIDIYHPEIDRNAAEDAFKNAALNGLWSAMETLLKKIPNLISDDCKGASLRLAIEGEHPNIVNQLLNLFSDKIHKVYKLVSLRFALRGQNNDIINLLLSNESVIEASVHSIRSIFQQVNVDLVEPHKNTSEHNKIIDQLKNIPGVRLIFEIYSEIYKKDELKNNQNNEKIKNFLSKNSSKIKKSYKKAALELAVEEKRLDILNALLSDPSVSDIATWNNNVILQEAKRYINTKHENIFNALMDIPAVALIEKSAYSHDVSLLSPYIKESDKGRALISAAENDNAKFLKSILNAWNKNISKKYKVDSLIKTIEEDKFDAFCVLIDDEFSFNEYITPNNKGVAFAIAAENSNKKFVELMLEKWGGLIPFYYKKNALKNAIKEGNVDVFITLLESSSIAEIIDEKMLSYLMRRVEKEVGSGARGDNIEIIYESIIEKLNVLSLGENVQNNEKEKRNRL